jgi:chaperone required for assembly of F1-ATPase
LRPLRSDDGHCELPLKGRFDPFGAPFGNGRYLRVRDEEGMSQIDVKRTYANCASRPIQLASIGRARDMADADRIGLLALAVARGFLSAEAAWQAAHVDEDFQAERWGADAEAVARREARWREFEAAATGLTVGRRV